MAAHAASRVVRPRSPVPVGLTRRHPRHEGVPDVGVVVLERNLRLSARLVEQAQHHAVGGDGGHGEVRPPVGYGRAQREPASGQRGDGLPCYGGHRPVSVPTPRITSPTAATAPCLRRITSAMSPVQPVWCAAPIAAPLSPWKYSLKTRLSRHSGSFFSRSMPPKHGRRPLGPRVKIEISRSCKSAATVSRVS